MSHKAHVGLDCSNLERSVAFFRDCGFAVGFVDEDRRNACLETEAFEVNLFERPAFPGYVALSQLRCLHLGFQVRTERELAEVHAKLSPLYPAQQPYTRIDGDTCFFVQGPDGLRVEFFCGTHHIMREKYGK